LAIENTLAQSEGAAPIAHVLSDRVTGEMEEWGQVVRGYAFVCRGFQLASQALTLLIVIVPAVVK
jgi:hypothetical protein